MVRKLFISALVVSLVALTSVAVLARGGSPHVVGDISASGLGTDTLTLSGKIAGLGSGWNGATAEGDVDVTFDVTCISPGGNAAPGQQGGSATLPGEGTVGGPDANGQYTFTLTATVDTSQPKRLGCPNNNWTAQASITDFELLSLTLTSDSLGSVNVRL